MTETPNWKAITRWTLYTGILILSTIWLPSYLIRGDLFAGAGFFGYPARLHTEQAIVFLTIPLLLLIREDRSVFQKIFMGLAILVFLASFLPYKPVFYSFALIFFSAFFFYPSGKILESRPAGQLLWLGIGSAIGGFAFFFTALVTQKAGLYLLGRTWLYYGSLILIPLGTYLHSIGFQDERDSIRGKLDTVAIWLYGLSLGIEALYRIGVSRDVPAGAMDFVRTAIVAWWVYRAVSSRKSTPAILSGSFLLLGLAGHTMLPAMGSHFAHLAFLGGVIPYSLLAISRLSGVTPVGGLVVPYLFMGAGVIRVLAGLYERVVFLPVFLSALLGVVATLWLMYSEWKREK